MPILSFCRALRSVISTDVRRAPVLPNLPLAMRLGLAAVLLPLLLMRASAHTPEVRRVTLAARYRAQHNAQVGPDTVNWWSTGARLAAVVVGAHAAQYLLATPAPVLTVDSRALQTSHDRAFHSPAMPTPPHVVQRRNYQIG